MAMTETTRGTALRRAGGTAPALRALPDVEAPRADPAAARAFGEVLGRAGDRPGLDAVLRPAAEALCDLLDADRCSVYLRGGEGGCFHGRLGHPASLDPVLRRLILDPTGEPAVREAVGLRTPVALPDAPPGPRPAQAVAVRRQHTGSVLIVPVSAGGRVLGVAFVEDRDRRRRFGTELESAAAAFAALLGRWMDRSLRVAELAAARDALARERRAHARIARVERAIGETGGAGRRTLLEAVAVAAEVVVELRDGSGELVLRAGPADADGRPSPDAAVGIAAMRASTVPDDDGTVVVPLRSGRTDGPSCAAALVRTGPGDGPHVVLVLPAGGRPGTTDRLIAARIAAALTVRQAPVGEPDDAARATLLAGVLGGGLGPHACDALAVRLGIDPEAPRLVVLSDGGALDLDAVRSALPAWAPVEVVLGTGSVLVVQPPADVERRAAAGAALEALADAAGMDVRVVVSAPSTGLIGLPRALREARGAAVVAGPSRSLTVESLGPARLFACEASDARDLATELLGPLLRAESAGGDLVETLRHFFAAGASVTETAAVLGLHANTIRHRFARIRERTGLDVLGDVGDQLTAQAAVIALRS
ncbi:helix-turn-helix domain-containing protein [Patulibacter minatonensis]|uniref:helix-turn-helix domain-containing protein n=1 Tax=Patulibacter minatonensis TaxID=298163 RepID=UPI00047BA97F|nr:GAF domain-containing protein [Patulibacter minatonensis]